MSRRHRRNKTDDTRLEIYGRSEVLNEFDVDPIPERELFAAVIMQAVINISCKVKGWQEDLMFVSGGKNFPWICEQLGYDTATMSRMALKAATLRDFRFAKWR